MSQVAVVCTQCRTPFGETALYCAQCGTAKPRVAHDELIGKVLGERFTILARIGGGASGDVYRAEHVTLRRKVAVKVLHHELSRDDLAVERFRREATTVAEIDNEHIVEIHDFGRTHDGRLYMAMELLEGEPLDEILAREKQLSIERTADILIQVSEALMEAHAIGYVHRDLRPRNILLSARRGQANFVKLLDFGLAKLVDSDQQAASTSLGMTFGDPRYMSPEQARGDRIDRRADIYQLGCVAYEMLTGAPPFTGDRVFDILSKQVTETPTPLPTKRAGTPLWIEATVARMLAKNPDNRFATTTRLVEALRRGLATGEIMDEDVARRRESIPPPSVSRVMQKLGLPLAEDVAPAAALVTPPAAASTAMNTRQTQLGTPSLAQALAPATRDQSGSTQLGVPQQNSQDTVETAKGLPAVARNTGKTGTPYAGTAAIAEAVPAVLFAPAPVIVDLSPVAAPAPTAAMPVAAPAPTAAMPVPEPQLELPAEPPPAQAQAAVSAAHAVPSATPAAADQSGVSSVWFAEGDLPDESAVKPRRARRDSYSSSATDLVETTSSKKRLWLIGAAVLLIGGSAAAFVATRGSDDKTSTVAIVPVDAAMPSVDAPLADAPIDAPAPAPVSNTGGGNSGGNPRPVQPVQPPNMNIEPTRPPTGDTILDRRPASFNNGGTTPPANGGTTPPANGGTTPPANGGTVIHTTPTNGSNGTDETVDPYANNVTPVIITNNNGSDSGTGVPAPTPTPTGEDPIKQAESLAFIGEQALATGDAGGAAANFRKALELNPKNLAATIGLGELALQQGAFGDAAKHLRKATRMAPRSSRAFTLLGEAQLGNGNKNGAAESFKQALTLDADNARARKGYEDASQ
ncbi:MAG TPA: protein kinase [Kofleriaceae bacterium]|nr:protein kinase [Kofleriaceae bacterium]